MDLLEEAKIGALIGLLAVAVGLSWYVRSTMADNEDLRTKAAQTAKELDSVKAAKDQQAKLAEHANNIAAEYQKSKELNETELQASIDRLNANLRMRKQQLAAAQQQLREASASSTGDIKTSGSDFLETHGNDALRLTSEADDVTNQLTACQKLLEDERK